MSAQHTKGPWWVDVHGNILSPGGKMVAFPCISGDLPQAANAARIVLCCNAHDELVAATEAAYTKLADYRIEWPGRHTADGQLLLCILRDAIVAATGRTPEDVQDDYGTRLARAALTKAAPRALDDAQPTPTAPTTGEKSNG